MRTKHFIVSLLFLLVLPVASNSQYANHEVGFSLGAVSLRGDWGERENPASNYGNSGISLQFLHFANYAYSRRSNSYFNNHFKLRNQLNIHFTKLNHYGRWVENERAPFLLSNMYGSSFAMELGTGLEWYWKRIRSYERSVNSFQPYAGFGINVVYYFPYVRTNLPGRIGTADNTWPTFLPESPNRRSRISNSSDFTLAANFQTGTKFRINNQVDLFLEGRWHYYFTDYLDGLKPLNQNNISNDWAFFIHLGFTYYLD